MYDIMSLRRFDSGHCLTPFLGSSSFLIEFNFLHDDEDDNDPSIVSTAIV